MRFVNADGRAGLLLADEVFDLQELSGGRLPSDPVAVLRHHWDEARRLHDVGATSGGTPVDRVHLGPPTPEPRAVFGVGLNYKAHAAETGREPPAVPAVFTKYPTSLVGPFDTIVLPRGRPTVDWEAELAFVLADAGRHVPAAEAYDAILGFTVAQDISERTLQYQAGQQYSMGKSFDTFCPIGPAIVTLDELPDPADLHVRCTVNGETKQDASTADLIFDVPALVAHLSSVCTLRAGDLCLTGTPSGVGAMRQPPEWLADGDVVETEIEHLGRMRNPCAAEPPPAA